jgi:hypothetical protein
MYCAAGKKAIRRKEVQVNGSVARTDMLLQEGDAVRVVVKVGSGAVWGSTAGKKLMLHSNSRENTVKQ